MLFSYSFAKEAVIDIFYFNWQTELCKRPRSCSVMAWMKREIDLIIRDISNFSHIKSFLGQDYPSLLVYFFSFFGRSIDQILFFCDNNPFTFCWVVKRNKLGAIWHSHNVTFASFCELVHEVITPPQNTLFYLVS